MSGATDTDAARIELAERLADAIAGYFDFGEGMADERWREGYRIGLHVADARQGWRLIGPDEDGLTEPDRAAIGRALAYIRTHLHANDVPAGGNLLEDHLARWAAFDAIRDDVTEADLAALERLAGGS